MKRKVRICVVVKDDGSYSAYGMGIGPTGWASNGLLKKDAMSFADPGDRLCVSYLSAEVPMPGPPEEIKATLETETKEQ